MSPRRSVRCSIYFSRNCPEEGLAIDRVLQVSVILADRTAQAQHNHRNPSFHTDLQTFLRSIDPGERRLEGRVAAGEERRAAQRHWLVRYDAASLDANAGSRDEISPRVYQDVAIRQPIEQRGERLPHRGLPEDARATERLQSSGEALGGAAGHAVHENGDRAAEGHDALAGAIHEPRI